jgi:DNA-binding SARP family transcriptional activator
MEGPVPAVSPGDLGAAGRLTAADDAQTDPATAALAIEQAAELYRGSYCEDCGYDGWALLEREYHRTRRLDALGRLADLHLRIGDQRACLDVAGRLLSEDRCYEEALRLVMRAHARMGHHHLAIRQFRLCRRDLSDELGLAPAAETLELFQIIRRREPV